MKPRTKLQVEVWGLHQRLVDPKHQEPYVISNHDFYYTNHYKKIVCLECNHQWQPNQLWQEEVIGVVCPSCQKKLKKAYTSNGCVQVKIITYAVAQVVDRFQVIRYFSCWKHMSKKKPPRYSFHSLFEEWKDWDKNKRVIIGRTIGWTGDGFNSTDYEVRNPTQSGWRGNEYDRFASDINCPGAMFLPRFKKYGLNKIQHDCDFRFLIERIEKSPKIETLLKAKQKQLLFHAVHKDDQHSRFWPQIKIALRNRYKITDAGVWYDYLTLMRSFGKDIHNPKYVCPKNLKAEHNILVSKKQKIEEQEKAQKEIVRQERERARAEAEEALKGVKAELFKEFKITKGEITIVTLIEEEDVKNEGKILKHCVHTNKYHTKSGILLMSARIDGKPIETIEISLATYKIIQSRGYGNEPTQHHDQILNILKSNMGKISRIVEKQKRFKELDSDLSKLEKVA